MINKRIFFIIMISILIISLTTISANDLSDNKTNIHSNTQLTENNNIEQETVKSIAKTGQHDIKEASTITSYDELYAKLTSENAEEESVITLDGDNSTYTVTNTIRLSDSVKSLTLNGNGKIIDGNNELKFLEISHPCNFTLTNISIINCNSNDFGGAISITSDCNVLIDNCNFTKNHAKEGSAIYYETTDDNLFKVTNSRFILNSENNEYEDIETSGAICLDTYATTIIDNCTFINNIAKIGSAVRYYQHDNKSLIISHSTFNSNGKTNSEYRMSYGGAVYIDTVGSTSITDSSFKDNYAYSEGGAVIIETPEAEESCINIDNVKFSSNSVNEDGSGGALTIYGNEIRLNINNSRFSENKAKYGGSIYLSSNKGNFTITNSSFDSNKGTYGGAIRLSGYENSNLSIINSTFTDNGKNNYNHHYYYSRDISKGGAILLDGSVNIMVNNSKFRKNTANRGTVIFSENYDYVNTIINNSEFNDNGIYMEDDGETGYSETGTIEINTYGNVSVINSNFTNNTGESSCLTLTGNSDNNLLINASIFSSNGLVSDAYPSDGSVYIDSFANVSVDNSVFYNNSAMYAAGINYYADDEKATLHINNSDFILNHGDRGNALRLRRGNVSIDNSNFIKNYLDVHIDNEGLGGAIDSSSPLSINNTNFIENGINTEEVGDYPLYDIALEGGAIYMDSYDLFIDNSNFTSNKIGMCDGGAIRLSSGNLNANHTTFKNNIIYGYESGSGGAIYVDEGNHWIDQCIFINNAIILEDYSDDERSGGAIIAQESNCNVTNSVFSNNAPTNFVNTIDGLIIRNMSDFYVPSEANVTIYAENSMEGRNYSLTSDDYDLPTIKDFKTNPDNLFYRMIVTQTEYSEYYGKQEFYNNTYYITMPHELQLSVNTTPTIQYDDTNNITGKLYYVKSNNEIKNIDNVEIELYINQTYITSTKTDNNGQYSFKYNAKTLGTQEVTVKSVETTYMGEACNNTSFTVERIETRINIQVNNTVINNKTNITITLTDTNNNPIRNAEIITYIDLEQENKTTDENGSIIIEYNATNAGNNYILAVYSGDYGHNKTINSKEFHVEKLNTTITVNATNTTINNKTRITGKLTDINGNNISNVPITIIIDKETLNKETNTNGEFTFTYNTIVSGENYVTVIYEGNDTYKDSINKTVFNVEKLNTTLTITAENTTLNEIISITGKLSNQNNEAIKAQVILYVDDEKIELNTTDNGTFTYQYKAVNVGENYVEIIYEGNNTYKDTINQTTFQVNKINTTLTVTPICTTIKNTTLNINITGNDNKQIVNGTVIVYDENEQIIAGHDIEDRDNITITYINHGRHTLNITYTGNNTYNPSSTTQNVTILPESNITINMVNNTESNVELEIIATDETSMPLKSQDVMVTLPNGTTTNMTTDNNGKITITDTTSPSGEYKVTAEIITTDNIIGTKTDENIIIVPDYMKIIRQMNETIQNITQELHDKETIIKEQNQTIQNQTNTITQLQESIIEQNNTIQNLTNNITQLNKTIKNITQELHDKETIIKEQNQTIQNQTNTITQLRETITEQNSTIQNLTNNITQLMEIINTQNSTIHNLTEKIRVLEDTITIQNNTIKQQEKEITTLNNTINNLNEKLDDLNNQIKTWNKTSDIRAVADNGTVEDTRVIVILDNKLGDHIAYAPITITDKTGKTIGTGETDKDGISIIPVNITSGSENVTVTYAGNKTYLPSNTTISVTSSKLNTTIIVDPVNGIVGEDITLTAHVLDNNGNNISGGNLVFKLNGKTLRSDGRFDSNQTAWKFKVENGLVTVTIKADLYLRNIKNLTASYSGSYKYTETKSNTVTAQIKKRDAKITVTASPTSQKQYNTITFTAKLSDTTPNHKNTTSMSTGTYVIFKINGKTIKDSNGKNLRIKVVNNTAIYEYRVPAGMGGVTKDGKTRDYTVEAVLVSDTYYPDTRNTCKFNAQRSPISIILDKVSVNDKNQLSVKADIYDYMDNHVIGNNSVAVKVNGKTLVDPATNKSYIFTVQGGIINLSNIRVSSGLVIKKVMIVTGGRQAYLGGRNETTSIVNE